MEAACRLRADPQRLDRQRPQHRFRPAGGNDRHALAQEARRRMGRAPCVGDRRPRLHARTGEPAHHGLEHRSLAAMQMVRARGVDHQPVGRIGGDDGRDAPQGAQRQPVERLRVAGRVGRQHGERRHKRLRSRDRHADADAEPLRLGVDGGHQPARAGAADKGERRGERRIRRGRRAARFLPHAVCRPPWKKERYDPFHRMPPLRIFPPRPPGSG